MTSKERIDGWRQELLDIRSGWEFAFAHGARCNGATGNPKLQAVLERERELHALILEHTS